MKLRKRKVDPVESVGDANKKDQKRRPKKNVAKMNNDDDYGKMRTLNKKTESAFKLIFELIFF